MEQRIYGTPAHYMGTNKIMSSDLGGLNEINTALKLNALINAYEDLYVFHSVNMKNADGETDHILVFRNKIILLETKTHSGHHSFRVSSNGALYGYKGKRSYRIDDNKLYSKMESIGRRFPEYKVEGIIVISQRNVGTRSSHHAYNVVSLDTFENTLQERLDSDFAPNNKVVVKYFSALC